MSKRTIPTLKLIAVVFAIGILFLSQACSSEPSTSSEEGAAGSSEQAKNPCNPCNPCGGKMTATGQTEPDAANYKAWSKLSGLVHSAGHGGKYVITYANSDADGAIKGNQFPFKSGAKFIKEGYDDEAGKTMSTLYVMEKRGDQWYYAMATPQGNLTMEGVGEAAGGGMCQNCHATAKNDYVFAAGGGTGKMPANPCNPCNPCAKKNPCNPCAKKNPCNPCAKKNPCNPCGKY